MNEPSENALARNGGESGIARLRAALARRSGAPKTRCAFGQNRQNRRAGGKRKTGQRRNAGQFTGFCDSQ
jgi:hypothetical protein